MIDDNHSVHSHLSLWDLSLAANHKGVSAALAGVIVLMACHSNCQRALHISEMISQFDAALLGTYIFSTGTSIIPIMDALELQFQSVTM